MEDLLGLVDRMGLQGRLDRFLAVRERENEIHARANEIRAEELELEQRRFALHAELERERVGAATSGAEARELRRKEAYDLAVRKLDVREEQLRIVAIMLDEEGGAAAIAALFAAE